MQIDFTKDELRVLKFYMNQAKIDAEGKHAIGITSKRTVDDVHSALGKIIAASYKSRV